MIYGSAGLTAGLSVHKLMLNGVRSNTGHVLVTGATGGVGCLAVALLAHLGFHVVAATGKREEGKFLTDLGAREVIGREEATDRSGKALLSAQWVGVVDTVGGQMLETAIRRTKIEGTVACCGNIGSVELHTSIYPFILRGVTLAGIGSAFLPSSVRNTVWQKLSNEWRIPNLDHLTTEVSLDELNRTYIDKILHGKVRGRILVNTQVS
jgi:putative YhdH/YhfP family quinone oxidoreductase